MDYEFLFSPCFLSHFLILWHLPNFCYYNHLLGFHVKHIWGITCLEHQRYWGKGVIIIQIPNKTSGSSGEEGNERIQCEWIVSLWHLVDRGQEPPKSYWETILSRLWWALVLTRGCLLLQIFQIFPVVQ